MPFRTWLLVLLLAATLNAEEQKWEKLEGCTLVQGGWKDGDSFHAKHNGKEYIFRLYFVDTCEDAGDTRFPERVAEQAAYFGVSSERAFQLGDEAAKFTASTLSAKPFTVYTMWKNALGASSQQRFYGYVLTDKGPLCELLVQAGLARIYGVRTPLPDGTDSRTYLQKLDCLKERALANKVGGWGDGTATPSVAGLQEPSALDKFKADNGISQPGSTPAVADVKAPDQTETLGSETPKPDTRELVTEPDIPMQIQQPTFSVPTVTFSSGTKPKPTPTPQ